MGQQNLFLVAEPEDDVIAGYIGLYGSYDEGDITNVAVAEAFRGNGIGTLLVKSMKEMAVRRGIRRIYLEVRDSNETARRVYEKAGFSVCGRRKKFYRQPEEDAVLFRKYAELNNMNLSEMIRQTVLKRIEEDFDLETYRKALEEFKENPETTALEEEDGEN